MRPDSLRYRDGTADEVLEVIREAHRQQLEFDPEAEPVNLAGDTTVADWMFACDIPGWRKAGEFLQFFFGVPIHDWRDVLTPTNEKTLGEVCQQIAGAGVQLPDPRLISVGGNPCRSASVFFSVLSLLEDDGANVNDIRPSTELTFFLTRHPQVFLGEVSRIRPGVLPSIKIARRWFDYAFHVSVLFAVVFGVLGDWLGFPYITLGSILLPFVTYLAQWLVSLRYPTPVTFPCVETFGDLARLLASDQQASTSAVL